MALSSPYAFRLVSADILCSSQESTLLLLENKPYYLPRLDSKKYTSRSTVNSQHTIMIDNPKAHHEASQKYPAKSYVQTFSNLKCFIVSGRILSFEVMMYDVSFPMYL